MAARKAIQRPSGGQLRHTRATPDAAPSGQLVASPDQLAARPPAGTYTLAPLARHPYWAPGGVR